MSAPKGGRGKRGTKEREKIFQKKKNENILYYNLYLQVLVLVITEMQIRLNKY